MKLLYVKDLWRDHIVTSQNIIVLPLIVASIHKTSISVVYPRCLMLGRWDSSIYIHYHHYHHDFFHDDWEILGISWMRMVNLDKFGIFWHHLLHFWPKQNDQPQPWRRRTSRSSSMLSFSGRLERGRRASGSGIPWGYPLIIPGMASVYRKWIPGYHRKI